MALRSKKGIKVQEMLFLCLGEEIIGEEKFVLLYESIQAE